MPRTAAPDADPRKLARDAAYKERRRLGLVVVPVTVHHTRRAEIEAAAKKMQTEKHHDETV
jgi:hypothetical protein